MWHDLLGSRSAESLHFRAWFGATTEEIATRRRLLDDDRECAIIAEIEEVDRRVLIGLGRFVDNADQGEAEFVVFAGEGKSPKNI